MLHEPDELVELDHELLLGRQRPGEERRRAELASRQRPRTVERDAIEAPRPLGHQRACVEVAQVERLQRVLDDHPLPGRRHVREPRGAIDDVEQLAERDGRRSPQVRPLIAGRVRDHQVVGRGQHRVEQQLTILAAGVAITDVRIERGAGRRRRAPSAAGRRRRRVPSGRRPGAAPTASGRACRS